MGKTFDFEALYKAYPRKEGKKRGLNRLRATIKTEAEFNAFRSAMENYISLCTKEQRETRYIKHWGTFVNSWTDYLSKEIAVDRISTSVTRLQGQVARIMRGEI